MLKISEIRQNESQVEYRLDGSLSGPWVEELRRLCALALAQNCTLVLNLRNLRFVDKDGAALLRELAAQHVSQLNSSAFVRAHVQGGM
jgi:ABC-type transporter Mla MlaB component